MAKTKQDYADSGVEISKAAIGVGDEVTVLYKGLLAQSGADTVYAHVGYGENWDDKAFIPMERDADVFKTTIKISQPEDLNIAFKDSGDNWDNNSMENYSFKVTKKAAKTAKDVKEEKEPEEQEKTVKKAAVKTAKATETNTATAKKSTAAKSTTAKKTTTTKRATKKAATEE